jgi:hypothetical protein
MFSSTTFRIFTHPKLLLPLVSICHHVRSTVKEPVFDAGPACKTRRSEILKVIALIIPLLNSNVPKLRVTNLCVKRGLMNDHEGLSTGKEKLCNLTVVSRHVVLDMGCQLNLPLLGRVTRLSTVAEQ